METKKQYIKPTVKCVAFRTEVGFAMSNLSQGTDSNLGVYSEENLKMANDLGYCTIFWSFAYADWDNKHQMSADAAIKKLTAGLHNGEVLLLHPTSETNAAILGGLIKTWKEQGFRFGTLDELTRHS